VTKTAFLFPGQGAQVVGMGATLAASLPSARELFSCAADILGYDLLKLCTMGPPEELNSTVHSQPALFVCSLAALEKLREDSPEVAESCVAMAGLSLGEYTALVAAEAMDFASALKVVQIRGQAMQAASDASPSGMVSVLGLEREQVEQLVDEARAEEVLRLANFLCPGNIVVSGSKSACERLIPLAEAAGAMKVIPLTVAGAFHTPLMQPAVEQLRAALAQVIIHTPRIPVVSNVDARPHEDPEEIRGLLVRQVVEPVLWEDSLGWLIGTLGIEQFYEIGPGKVLRGLLKRIARKLPCESIEA
jgi:[acyl-carrier-protein] S-malonyltransferase